MAAAAILMALYAGYAWWQFSRPVAPPADAAAREAPPAAPAPGAAPPAAPPALEAAGVDPDPCDGRVAALGLCPPASAAQRP